MVLLMLLRRLQPVPPPARPVLVHSADHLNLVKAVGAAAQASRWPACDEQRGGGASDRREHRFVSLRNDLRSALTRLLRRDSRVGIGSAVPWSSRTRDRLRA